MLFRGGIVREIIDSRTDTKKTVERTKAIYKSISELNKRLDWLKNNYGKIAKQYDLNKVKDELTELAHAGNRIADEIKRIADTLEKISNNPILSKVTGVDIEKEIEPLCKELDKLSEKIEWLSKTVK